MIKTTIVAAILTPALSFVKLDTKYSQIFAEKKIIVTEKLTVFEQAALPFKKGFVSFEF